MRNRKNTLIIVSVLFVLLLGLLFFLISMPAPEKDVSLDTSSVNFDNLIKVTEDKKIASITVKNQKEDYELKVESKDDKQVYNVTGWEEGKTSNSKANALYESLINLKPTQKIDNVSDFSTYGLSEPTAELTVKFSDGEKIKLFLGNDAPLGKGAYIKIEADDTVYLIDETDKEIFLNEKNFYQEKEEKTAESSRTARNEIAS